MRTQTRSDGWRPPCNIVIYLLFVWQNGSSLCHMVYNRRFSKCPMLFLKNMSILVSFWKERLINDVIENDTDIFVQVLIEFSDGSSFVLTIREIRISLSGIFFRLVLPVVANTAHKFGIENKTLMGLLGVSVDSPGGYDARPFPTSLAAIIRYVLPIGKAHPLNAIY